MEYTKRETLIEELKGRIIDNKVKSKAVVEQRSYANRAPLNTEPYVSKPPLNTPGDAWSYVPSSLSSHARAFHA